MVAGVSKDNRASTSVETRPGTICRIFSPKMVNKSSMMSRINSARGKFAPSRSATAWSSNGAYSGCETALKMSEGFVVASCGENCRMLSKSPVSATTVVNCFSWSSWFMG